MQVNTEAGGNITLIQKRYSVDLSRALAFVLTVVPIQIQHLLSWLNPKGVREHKLKNELLKQQTNIIESIKKRANVRPAYNI